MGERRQDQHRGASVGHFNSSVRIIHGKLLYIHKCMEGTGRICPVCAPCGLRAKTTQQHFVLKPLTESESALQNILYFLLWISICKMLFLQQMSQGLSRSPDDSLYTEIDGASSPPPPTIQK